jgi:broad specificity phosphatase PhoE
MKSIFEAIEWGKPIQQLLGQINALDPEKPAIIQIRHSERPEINLKNMQTNYSTPLTERGANAAYQFGSELPKERSYHMYHTDVDRSVSTAEKIHQGVIDDGGVSEVKGEIPLAMTIDGSAVSQIFREMKKYYDEAEMAQAFTYRWATGRYPPWVLMPCIEFAQRGASLVIKSLRDSDKRDVHIWVSHDSWVAAFLMHWLGESCFDWVTFMDGFILQLNEDTMTYYFRDKKKDIKYPYWWNF